MIAKWNNLNGVRQVVECDNFQVSNDNKIIYLRIKGNIHSDFRCNKVQEYKNVAIININNISEVLFEYKDEDNQNEQA